MKALIRGLVALLCLAAAAPSLARPVTDCPLRDVPFSADLPIIDLLLSPAAKAIVDRELGTSMDKMPRQFVGTQAPSFAAIITLHQAAGFLRKGPDAVARANAALRRLPVTPADRIARCARYDNDLPRFTLPAGRPRLLLFEKINGFKDVPSVDAARAAFLAMAKRRGWALVTTDKGGAMNPATLRQFDTVIWNNVSGDVLTLSQRRAFRDYIEQGGGFIGIHGSAGDPVYFWDWYADGLIGARFAGHPTGKQFQTATLRLDDAAHPIARGLPKSWEVNDEWYSFRTNPRASGSRIIATLDESTYDPAGMAGQNLRMGDHPIVWTRCVGRGRIFYSAIGHRPERYADPLYVRMLEQAVGWTAGRPRDACKTAG